ncbi:MAG TPA: isoprenylcysteine carboxylmethyltransferase family protein [Rhizomicrobium sp.]|nr:isoprenylcysteine carboxylmethyltransferase family protein [Rhizomicrobium sp.]
MKPVVAVLALWIGFAVSWAVAMPWRSAPEKTLGFGRELAYRIILVLGGVIFFIPAHRYDGPLRLWWVPYSTVWPLIGVIALGFLFAWWARIWLGNLWSGNVTKKPDHRVVDTGPYAIVRHPIYTGILIAVYATMALKGTIPGIAGAALITIGLWMKAKLEENWLRQELGTEDYDAYRRRVPMLIPLGPKAK